MYLTEEIFCVDLTILDKLRVLYMSQQMKVTLHIQCLLTFSATPGS